MIASDNNVQRISGEFARFHADLDSAAPPWLTGLRREAFRRFENLGFPTTRQEEWRFTNVKRIAETEFTLAEIPAPLSRETISPFVFDKRRMVGQRRGQTADDGAVRRRSRR